MQEPNRPTAPENWTDDRCDEINAFHFSQTAAYDDVDPGRAEALRAILDEALDLYPDASIERLEQLIATIDEFEAEARKAALRHWAGLQSSLQPKQLSFSQQMELT